jgi:hypothetical protein
MTHATKSLETLGNSIAYRIRQYDLHEWPLSSVSGPELNCIGMIQLKALIVAHACYTNRKDVATCAREVGTHAY